jgi:acyl-CoA synthetase (AMP-forming)/AMP-acid ligase II
VLPPGEVGELFSKCSGRFDEYYKNPEKTKQALKSGWFTAGDLGFVDEEGYFYIVDRKKDMIISGGENIYPREIEDVLRGHPAIDDCAVFGIPDDRWGEAVMAYIVLKQGKMASQQEIKAHCKTYLAGFKQPKFINFVEDLPRTASGKIMKGALRDQYWKKRKERV